MSIIIEIIKAIFGQIFQQAYQDMKKPDEVHVVGGDKEIREDISDDITDQILGDDDEK